MKAILLDKPMPDEYPEVHFDVSGLGTWVHFEDEQYEDWIGVFGDDPSGYLAGKSFAVPFGKGGAALVSALGRSYVVDVNSRKLLFMPDIAYPIGAIYVPERDFVLEWNFTDLLAIGLQEIVWEYIAPSGSDEMQITSATSDHALGTFWSHGSYYDFVLHYDGWQFNMHRRD